jgi:hypothetical protein
MKKTILLFALALVCQVTFAQQIKVIVDSITKTENVVTGMYYRVIKTVPDTSQQYFSTPGQVEKVIPEAQQKFKYLNAINKVQEKAVMDTTYSIEFRNAMLQDYLSTRKAAIEAKYNFIQLRSVRDTLISRSRR